MPRTILLTLGRLPKALDLARGFAAAGHRVVVAEPHRWHLSRMSRSVSRSVQVPEPATDSEGYARALLEIVDREGVDLIVPVSEEILHVASLRDRLPHGVRLACMSARRLFALHHKQRFVESARVHGLPVPLTEPLTSSAAAALAASRPTVVKPVLSCAGRGVQFLEAGAALPPAAGRPESIVQAFVDGNLLSTFTIARDGAVIASVVYRARMLSGTVAVCFERVDDAGTVERFIEDFVRAETVSGFIGFDFVVEPSGRAVAIECNPRATSGLHFLDETALARAVLDEGDAVEFRPDGLLQQFWPCLTETQAAMFRGAGFRERLGALFRARDVTWRLEDPLPLLLMPLASYPILALSLFRGLSFGEAATRDIEWSPPRGQVP